VVEEILGMGFDTIEVSHGLKVSLLPGIQKMHENGKVKVSGLHNFCPSPVEVMIDAPDAYEYTSHRSNERERALKLTLKTIEMAAQLKGGYVVLHLGSVPMPKFTAQLEALALEGESNSRKFAQLKLKAVQTREKLAPLYLRRAKEALTEAVGHAEKHQIKLSVESRSHYEQVPSEREMAQLMEDFADNPWVGYWHDFGHVQRKANLSLLDHTQWLEKMRPHLVGCHLHDVRWPARDHQVPFHGNIDYPALMPHVPEGRPVVWELNPRRKKSEIIEALALWKERYPETV